MWRARKGSGGQSRATRSDARRKKGSRAAETITPEQMAALTEFDRAVRAATDDDLPRLIVPPVLGPQCGGGLRLRGCSLAQRRALLRLKKAQEQVLGRDPDAARIYLGIDSRRDDEDDT